MHFGLIDGVMHQSQTKEPATLERWGYKARGMSGLHQENCV